MTMVRTSIGLAAILSVFSTLAQQPAPTDKSVAEQLQEVRNTLANLEKQNKATAWANKLKVAGLLQADARYYHDDDGSSVDTFLVRRARIDVRGNVSDNISFRILPEFGDSNDGHLLDAYVDWKTAENSSWRIGKFKSPVGLERVQSVPKLLFIERGLTDNLVPNRDVGIAWHYKDNQTQLTLGIGNNAGDRQDTDIDSDDGKAFFGRVYWQPEVLAGLGIGVAGSIGDTDNNATLPTYKTSSRATVFRYNTDVLRDGTESRIAPHFVWYGGSFGAFGEYIISKTELTNSQNQHSDISNTSWQLVASWMLTGEQNSWGGIKANEPSGAWELVARVASLDVDDAAFINHASLSRSVSQTDSFTVGLSWYANSNTKILFNYEQSRFEGGAVNGDRENENLLSARLQLSY
jgi:phosphate-selective porin OprO and OprP